MTELEIARNHRAITNMAGRLEAWGLDDAYKRAEFLLMNAYADGYRPVDKPPALHGPSSTEAGRRAAREIFAATLREKGK